MKKKIVIILIAALVIICTVCIILLGNHQETAEETRTESIAKSTNQHGTPEIFAMDGVSVVLSDKLKDDTRAIEAADQIRSVLSINSEEIDNSPDKKGDILSALMIDKTTVTLKEIYDDKCEVDVTSPDLEAIVTTVINNIPDGLNVEEIRDRSLELLIDSLKDESLQTKTTSVTMAIEKTDGGSELIYGADFLDAVLGGILTMITDGE